MEAIRRDVAWHEEQDELHYRLGEELRRQIPPDRWIGATVAERREFVERAAALMALQMGTVRETPIAWVTELKGELEYCEHCGAIHIRREHLSLDEPSGLFAGLASEVRHAWQLDVINGPIEHPLGDSGRSALKAALASYNADNNVNYTSNTLETDAGRAQVYVGAGYAGQPKPA